MKRIWLIAGVTAVTVFFNVRLSFAASQNQFTALSAEADPHTGSANFAVPIEVPPGRGGIQPGIQLHYNSSAPNGILGVGWNLELGAVQRSGKEGVPRYDDTDTFVLIQSGGAQELVYDSVTGLYRAKTEGAFMKIERLGGFWKATDKSGTVYTFGETPASQEYDPADSSRVFKWCLNKVEDLRGNTMTMDYFRDENKLYPQNIDYTGNSQKGWPAFGRVVFEREVRPENEIDRYNAGFRMSARYRVSRITASAGGNLQRRYDLVYDDSRTTGRSLLSSVIQFGSDGTSSLPSMTFSYQTPKNPDFTYDVTPMNSAVSGDNLWNYRVDYSYDRGHENYGPCPPTNMCNSVNWGPLSTKGGGNGSVSFSSGQDAAHWLWTYLYVDNATTLSVPYQTGGVDGVWVNANGNYSQHVGPTWALQPGYNLVEITLYHQHEGFSFNLNYALADNVGLMSSSTVILPQISGDFNADGRSDIATFTSSSGKVTVERSNGTAFAGKETWITGFGTNGKLVAGDFNGDGRVDVSGFDPASGNWRVASSDGTRFNDAGLWLSGFGANEEPSTGDFNADGLADVMTFYKSSGNLYVRIALNQGGSFAALSGGQNILIGTSGDTPIAGDFNGDGQVDFGAFNKSAGNWDVRLNTGDILAGLRQIPGVSGFGAGRNTVVSDFNYDGLTDIGYYDDSTGKVIYRVSKGLSFAAAAELPFVFTIKGPNTQIQSGDFNGDTLIDFAVYNLIGRLEIAFSDGVMPDILSSVENGLGGQSLITYNAAVNYPQTFLPFPIQVVASITKSNGLGESYTIQNSYEQGLWDAQKREFRGFGLVRVTDPDGNYADTFFAQDGTYKGRMTEQRVYDASGKLYSKTVNTWAHQEIIPDSNFIYLSRKDNFVYDGDGAGRRTAEEFFYGETPQYGSLTKAVQLGEVDFATGGDTAMDTRSVETTYVNNTAEWLIGLPSLTVVKDNAGSVVRKTGFDYINGLLTRKEDWAGDTPGAVNPVTQYTYDTIGNLLTTTDALGRVTAVAYDSAYTMFPVTTTNALGHQVVNEYYGVAGAALDDGSGLHGLWGQLKSTTDPNNQAGRRVYDVFGRPSASISPKDSIAFPTQTTKIEFLGSYTKVTSRARVEHGKPETIDTVSFIDGFGREVQTKTRSEVNGRYVVSGQAQYNSRGLKSKEYLPAFSANPMDVIDAIDTAKPHTLISYDAMGRVVKRTNPDGTYATILYDDWTSTSTDENGRMQKSYFDAYGRLIKKEEYLGADGRSPYYPAKPYTLYAATLYSYDSEGNLLKTIDAYGNTTTITYDPLGRKTAMDDPDMGHWSYQYDLNGNLIRQTDAKGQTLAFTYDGLNRLVNKSDAGAMNVGYTYDDNATLNSKGRLTQAAYANGNTQFVYDEVGRELQSIKEINGRTYSVGRSYDALSRLTTIQYPQGENIVYRYNAAGQIEAVANDPTLFPPAVLTAPELYLIQTGSTELKLSWGSVADAAGYKIKYGTFSGNYTTTLDAGGALSRIITGLTNDTTYYFVVSAYNANTESGPSNERFAAPSVPPVITMPAPLVQYAFNDNSGTTAVVDTGSGTHNAVTEQTSLYTSDLTGSGTASASSYLTWGCDTGACPPGKAFDDDYYNWGGWVAEGTKSGWLAYEFSTARKINRYVIWPRGHIYPNDDGNPRTWTFEGFNGSGWDILDTRGYSSWVWKTPVEFNFTNDTAYSKYRLNISSNGGHVEVGVTEMEMMAYAPLYTSTLSSGGKINNAFNFNGTSHLVNADSLLDVRNNTTGTIALWVNPSSPSVSDVIFSIADTDGNNRVELRAANNLEFYIANSVLSLRVSLPNALVPGVWSHVAVVQDGGGIKGYVNGNPVAVTVLDQSLGVDAWLNSTWGLDNGRIGCVKNNNQGNHNYYGGQLDDLRYYDHALKPAEIQVLYNTGVGTETRTPQYSEYTPLSKVSYDSTSHIVHRTSETDDVRSTHDERRITKYEVRGTMYSILAWLERHLLGVEDAYAQSALPSPWVGRDIGSVGVAGSATYMSGVFTVKASGADIWNSADGFHYVYQTLNGDGEIIARVDSVQNTYSWAKTGVMMRENLTAGSRHAFMLMSAAQGTAFQRRKTASSSSISSSGGTTLRAPYWVKLVRSGSTFKAYQSANGTTWAQVGPTETITMASTIYVGLAVTSHVNTVLNTSLFSNVSVTTAIAKPAAPVLNSATAGDGQVSLSWNAFEGVMDYRVRWGTQSGVYTSGSSWTRQTSLTVTGLTNGTKYYFVVIAVNTAGDSANSNELSATPVPPAPAAPVLDSAVPGDGQVSLAWSSAAAAVGYKIHYGTVSGSYTSVLDVGDVTAYTLNGLTNGTTYYFTVTAYNSGGESVKSNELSAAPTAPVVIVPEDPTLFVKNVDYNAAGQIIKIEYGNGDVITYTYDPLTLRLTRLSTINAAGEILQDLNYTYDSAGNILSITDKVHTATQSFKYDELNRLTEANGGYGTKSYVYDTIGNIVEKDGKTYFYGDGVSAGPHAVTALSDGTTFTYDANGNMAAKTESGVVTAYTYDSENRLLEVKKGGSIIARYEYDGDGGRTQKVTSQGTVEFIGQLFEKTSGTGYGIRDTKYVFLGDQRIASVTNGTVLYYHADHLGGTNVLTDAAGFKKELIEYEPFGLEIRHEKYGSSEEVAWYYFTGKPKDDETGLYYFGARYYDPALGRFITADTIVPYPTNPQALNRYSYAGNNPVSHLEDGHGWGKWWKKAWDNFVWAVRHPFDIKGQWNNLVGEANQPGMAPITSAVITVVSFAFMQPELMFTTSMWTSTIASAGSAAFLESPAGQNLTDWTANSIYDNILGMRPSTARIWAGIDLGMTSSFMIERTLANIIADPVGTRSLTNEELKKLSSDSYFSGDEETFGPSLKSKNAQFDEIKGLTQNNTLVGSFQKRTLDVPGLKQLGAQHTSANALAVSGPQLNPLRYATWGVCHQATNATLLQGGISSTILTLGPSWDMFVTTAVYGNYGGQLGHRVYTGVNANEGRR